MTNFHFLSNGSLINGYETWVRFTKIIESKKELSGKYVTEIKARDAETNKLIGYYKIIICKEAGEEKFSIIQIINKNNDTTRLLRSAALNNELWLNIDANAYMQYANITSESSNTEAFDITKPVMNEQPDIKFISQGAITLTSIDIDQLPTSETISFFGGMPIENFIFGDNLRKTKEIENLDQIKASGPYAIKEKGEIVYLVNAVATSNTKKDDVLLFILDIKTQEVKIKKRIDGKIITDTINDLVVKWEGTELWVSVDGGKTFISKDLKGDKGSTGRMPLHKWEGTKLYIENSDKTWDLPVNLQGPVPKIIFSDDRSKVKFEQPNKAYTDWIEIKGDKGNIPQIRFIDKKGEIITDPFTINTQDKGIYMTYELPEGGYSKESVCVIGPVPEHRYLKEDGITIAINGQEIYYIQFKLPNGQWGEKAKVIGKDGLMGRTPTIHRFLSDGKTTTDEPDKTVYIAFDEQDQKTGELFISDKKINVKGEKGDKGISPTVAFTEDGKMVVNYGEKDSVTSKTLIPQPFWNGTKLKFQLGNDTSGNPIYSQATDLIGSVPAHEYDAEKKLIRFRTKNGWGKFLDFIGPKGEKGDKGDIIDHKVENGILYLQTPTGEWGDPISFRVNFEKKIEGELIYIRFYNELNGLDTGWIPITTVTIPADMTPLLHIINKSDLYPGSKIPNGYIERKGQTINLTSYKVLKQILIKNGLIDKKAKEWTLDNVSDSYVKVKYEEQLFDFLYPEGTVIARSNENITPHNDPMYSPYYWQETFLLEDEVRFEDFVTYKRLISSVSTPEISSSDIKDTTASFQFGSKETEYVLKDKLNNIVVKKQTGVQAIFKDLFPNEQYVMTYSVRDDDDSTPVIKSQSFVTKKSKYKNIPTNLKMTANTFDSITISADSIKSYGEITDAEITCIETRETLKSPATFKNLKVNTNYKFKAKYPETDKNLSSEYTDESSFKTSRKNRTKVPDINGDPKTAISFIDADTVILKLNNSTEDDSKAFFSVEVGEKHPKAIKGVIEGYSPLTINDLNAEKTYTVNAYYKESDKYCETQLADRTIFTIKTNAKKSPYPAPTNINIIMYEKHMKVTADSYIASDGEKFLAKVILKETGQEFYANGNLVEIEKVVGGGGENITAEIFYEENKEIAKSTVQIEKLVTIALKNRNVPEISLNEITTKSIKVSAKNTIEDNIKPEITCKEIKKTLESPATFDNLTSGTTYTIIASYSATYEYAKTIVTKKIATLKLDRTEKPILKVESKTAETIKISASNSTEDESVAQITCVEIGKTLESPAIFDGLTTMTDYTFTAKYSENQKYKSVTSKSITVKTL